MEFEEHQISTENFQSLRQLNFTQVSCMRPQPGNKEAAGNHSPFCLGHPVQKMVVVRVFFPC